MKTNFSQMLTEAKSRIEFYVQSAIVDFTEEIVRRMAEENVSRTDLAEKIGSTPAYVTKVLRGNTNFTLETMVKVSRALNSRVRIHLQREDCQSEWIEFLKSEPLSSPLTGIDSEWNDSAFQTDKKIIQFSYNESLSTGTS